MRNQTLFANAVIANQSINNGLIRTTNTIAWTGGNIGNRSSATPIEAIEQGAVDTTLALYNTIVGSVPRLPIIPPAPLPNSTLYPQGCNIIKYNNNGTVQWTVDISGGTVFAQNMATDGTNVYVVGEFLGTILFINSDGTYFTTPTPITTAANGCFVVKYNINGFTQWAAYLTSQTFLQLLSNVTDGVNSYQGGNCFINTNVYNSDGTMYGEPLKQSVNLYNAGAITSDSTITSNGTYIYIIDSNPIAYKFKTTGEVVKQQSLSGYGLSTNVTSIVYLNGYLYLCNRYLNTNRTIIWQLNTTLDNDPPVIFVSDIDYPAIDGVLSITTDYVSAIYMANINTPNVLIRADVDNSTTPPSLISVRSKNLNNQTTELAEGIISPFGISYTNYSTLSDGHLLITDFNDGHYPDVSGIIWDVAGVDDDAAWDPSAPALLLNANTYTGTGKYINVPKSVNGIYADPKSYNIYLTLASTNTFVRYNYNKPSGPTAPKITNIGNGTSLANITKLQNTLYTLNYAEISVLYSVTYPTVNRVSSKQVYPLAANYNSGFIIQYNPSGMVSWISQFGADNANCTVSAITIGPTGIYITGSYGLTSKFIFYNKDGNPSGIVLTTPSNNTVSSAFVAKYTTAGNAVWATSIGNANSTSGTAIYVDNMDNVYVAGIYYGNRTSGPLNVYSIGGNLAVSLTGYNSSSAAYLAKYSGTGIVQWATNIIATTSNTVTSIIANNSNIYLVGNATGNITCNNTDMTTFGPITISVVGNGILINYSTAGIVKWATTLLGGFPSYISLFGNYLYLSGQMISPVSIYNVPYDVNGAVIPPPAGQPINSGIGLSIIGGYNDFLISYNTDGIVQWAQNTSSPYVTQTSTGGLTYGKNVEYVSVSIQPPSSNTLYPYGTNIIKYNSGGTAKWVADISGYNVSVYGLGTDGTNLYGTGVYYSDAGIQGIPIFINSDKTITVLSNILTSSYSDGTFFVKYNSAGIAQWTNNVKNMYQARLDTPQMMVSNEIFSYLAGYDSGGQNVIVYNLDGTVFKNYPSISSVSSYLIRYNINGNPLWGSSISADGINYERCAISQIALSSSGIYIIGYFGNPLRIASTMHFKNANNEIIPELDLSTNSIQCMFVAKYNLSGTPIWSTKVEYSDSAVGYTLGVSIVIDESDNIYTVGIYSYDNGSIPAPVNVYSAGDQVTPTKQVYGWNTVYGATIILVKYNNNGHVLWTANIRRPNGDPIGSTLFPYGLTVSGGYIYIVGYAFYCNIATYDPTNATTNPDTGTQTQTGGTMLWNSGSSDPNQQTNNGILIVYNTDGIPQWKTHIIGTSPYTYNVGVIATSVVTGGGNVYVSGYFDSVGPPPIVTFYNTPDGTVNSNYVILNTAITNNFTVAYDAQGKVLWVKNINSPGTNGYTPSMVYANALYIASPTYV